jgi:predicted ATPase
MDRLPFVGRATELSQVIAALERGANGQGSVVLIEGEAGIGKSLLVTELKRLAEQMQSVGGISFEIGRCSEETGSQSAYHPFVEILSKLAAAHEPGTHVLAAVGTAARETATDWVRAFPLVGGFLGAGTKMLSRTAQLLQESDVARAGFDSTLVQYANTIETLARGKKLIVLVVEDAQWVDHASCTLLVALAKRISSLRLVIVVTCRAGKLGDDHPFRRARSDLEAEGCLQVVRLDVLNEAEINAYLLERFGTSFSLQFSSWLIQVCRGHPLFLSQYLNLLEQEQIIRKTEQGFLLDGSIESREGGWQVTGRLAREVPASSDIDPLLDRRIQGLLAEEREMLQIGAVQGLYFDSMVLAQVAEKKELTILGQLRQVAERDHVIRLFAGRNWMRDRSETYEFEHMMMRQALYRRLGRRERVLYHQEIGRVLAQLASESDAPPRSLLIDVAYHTKNAGQPATAASYYLRAARDSYEDGATVEAMGLCDEGLGCLRVLPPGSDRDTLLAETVIVDLLCSLYTAMDQTATVGLLKVAEEGEAAAERVAARTLLAEILALKGNLHIRIGNVREAIALQRRAVALAQETGDAVTEFIALKELGGQLAKEDLAASLAVRHDAHELFEHRVSTAELSSAQRRLVDREHASLLVLIGLGEFDCGDLEAAIDWLERGVEEMQTLRMLGELMAAHNYLAQVFASVGLYEIAQGHIEESLRLHDSYDRERTHPWVGYNLGLLAHILLEKGSVDSAVAVMDEAVRISEATEQIDLLTLVWNYQAELLLDVARPSPDLEAATRVLEKNLDVSSSAGLGRSMAHAASLMGQVLLRRGAFQGAYTYSAQAVAELDRRGDMPAVRSEEILYNHWLVLEKLGRPDEAARNLDRAWGIVQRKLDLMHKPEHRLAFLEKVPLNQHIARAYRAQPGVSAQVLDGGELVEAPRGENLGAPGAT